MTLEITGFVVLKLNFSCGAFVQKHHEVEVQYKTQIEVGPLG